MTDSRDLVPDEWWVRDLSGEGPPVVTGPFADVVTAQAWGASNLSFFKVLLAEEPS